MGLPPLPHDLDALLDGPFALPLRATLRQTMRTGLRVEARCVAEVPLHAGLVGRLMGQKTAQPILPPMVSKLGGRPYLEEPWPTMQGKPFRFVGQLNFAELGCKVEGLPQRGIFVVLASPLPQESAPWAWRWYPWPDERRVQVAPGPSLPRYECRLTAQPSPSVALGAAFDAEWDVARQRLPRDQSDAASRNAAAIATWIQSNAANVFSWLPTAVGGPGFRRWTRDPARAIGELDWVQLWNPLDHAEAELGDLDGQHSIMMSLDAVADEAFDGVDVLSWRAD